jgi:cytochrome c
MRLFSRTVWVTAAAAVAGVALSGSAALFAADDEDDDEADTAEMRKVADEALAKAVAKGKELWSSKDLFKKSCASCHENPDKPKLNLATREWSYPAYSRRKRGVVTLQQKIQEMIQFNSRGQPFDDKGADVAALAAYTMSLKKK